MSHLINTPDKLCICITTLYYIFQNVETTPQMYIHIPIPIKLERPTTTLLKMIIIVYLLFRILVPFENIIHPETNRLETRNAAVSFISLI